MVLRLHQAAVHSIELEQAAINPGTGTVLLGTTFPDAAARAGFVRQTHTKPVQQYLLEDAVFDTTVCTLHLRGELIEDTAYLTQAHERPAREDRIDTLLDTPEGSEPIIGYNRAWSNYYHWMVQAVPAIDNAVAISTASQPLVLLPPVGPRQIDALRLLGHVHAKYVSVAPHRRVQLRRCHYSELLNGHTAFNVSLCVRRTLDRLAAAARAEVPDAPLIYVARTDATHRRLRNEDALIAVMQRLGFRIVLPGALSLAQQIVTFRGARMVVGPPGAGMTNIAFCRPRSLVYELVPRYYPNACMNRLAQSGSLIYAADLFEGSGTIDNQLQGEWWVDLARVERAVADLLKLIS